MQADDILLEKVICLQFPVGGMVCIDIPALASTFLNLKLNLLYDQNKMQLRIMLQFNEVSHLPLKNHFKRESFEFSFIFFLFMALLSTSTRDKSRIVTIQLG